LTITREGDADDLVSQNMLFPFTQKLKGLMDFIPMNIILHQGSSGKGQALLVTGRNCTTADALHFLRGDSLDIQMNRTRQTMYNSTIW